MPTFVVRRAPQSPPVSSKRILAMADAMLEHLDLGDTELSILLTNDTTIRALNREHRHKDRPTDVLSFYFAEKGALKSASTPRLLGDIVISLDTAARQAAGRKRPLLSELRWLLAHGILHLAGYDHATVKQKREMTAWTRRLVQSAPLPTDTPPRRRS